MIPYEKVLFCKDLSGVYFHIPFCRKACFYCDFHFSVNRKNQGSVIEKMQKELEVRLPFFQYPIETIYLGGGTPSLLNASELGKLTRTIPVNAEDTLEVTMEVNPEDVTKSSLKEWEELGIDRLSLGVQSFFDVELKWMNRNHSSETSVKALELIQLHGGFNVSADLIFGVPGSGMKKLSANVSRLLAFAPNHISAYHLTLETSTPYDRLVNQGKYKPPAEANDQFLFISDTLEAKGYIHYEVSNFARPGEQARHNSNYWKRRPYLGIGPGAHSFQNGVRRWNIADNKAYVDCDLLKSDWFDQESLTPMDVHNEQIMTGLRTAKGVHLQTLMFSEEETILAKRLVENGLARIEGERLILNKMGWLMADSISSDFFRFQ